MAKKDQSVLNGNAEMPQNNKVNSEPIKSQSVEHFVVLYVINKLNEELSL